MNTAVDHPREPQSVIDIRPLFKCGSGGACPVLQTMQWQFEHLCHVGSTSAKRATELWGRELRHAIGYKRSRAPLWVDGKFRDRPVRYRFEMSLRTNGHIAARLTDYWYEDKIEVTLGFTSVAVLAPINGNTVMALVKAWRELGYMTKIHKGNWVPSALAVEMLKSLNSGA